MEEQEVPPGKHITLGEEEEVELVDWEEAFKAHLEETARLNKEKEELAKARGNALIATEELEKLQEEKKSFNAKIAKANEIVKAARAAQSAANRNRNDKVTEAKKNAEASIKEAQNSASVKIDEATKKVQNLQNQL